MDVEVPRNDIDADVNSASKAKDNLLSWKDILPLSMHTAACLFVAMLVSTYEDYDVTHTRPNPSTLRVPPSITSNSVTGKGSTTSLGRNRFDFIGAATRGMGWGPSDRGFVRGCEGGAIGDKCNFFEEWYGSSATTLQWKPSYNEVMLQHRSERVPRWNELDAAASKEQLQRAVLQLYHSLDELEQLKTMADDYQWDEMRGRLNPSTATGSNSRFSLPIALEYSMDILKASSNGGELPELIGFDWGSCAWRHCGAKADAQEALSELQGDVGMLEPFECRFIIDIVERSIRDVLAVVPEDLKPHENGVAVQPRLYEAYVPKAGNDDGEMGIDFEYTQALSEVRVDLSLE